MPPSYQTDSESQKIANLIPSDAPVGDYYVGVRKFQTGNVARWQHFPVLIHLPPNSPELWRKNLNEDVKKWSAYVPMKTAADYESFVIDVKWENKLPPGVFGITRIEGSGPLKGNYFPFATYVLPDRCTGVDLASSVSARAGSWHRASRSQHRQK